MKSVALSLVYSRATIVRAGGLGGLLGFVGEARAVGGLVVDDRDLLGAQRLNRCLADDAALLHVVGHHAERGLEALQRVLRDWLPTARSAECRHRCRAWRPGSSCPSSGGRRRRRPWRRPASARRSCPASGRPGRLRRSSSNLTFLPSIMMPLALASSIARRAPFSLSLPRCACGPVVGADVADLDDGFRHGWRGGRGGRRVRGLLRLFLAAAVDGHQRCGDERQAERAIESHECPPQGG